MSIPAMWLYVATGRSGVRKVGSTINPERRIQQLREEYWQPFRLNRTWHRPAADARLVERISYGILRQHRSSERPLCFELYDAPLATLYAAIECACSKVDAGILPGTRRPKANRPGPSRQREYVKWYERTLADWPNTLKAAEEELASVQR